ncbi:MAG: DUF420 domain-containing protein [Bdellovibrionales bacterium]|nr:DUF420 domain-containing protein [Bdellovibrionales bacterium]
MNYAVLPTLNACLNATSFVLILIGVIAIKCGRRTLHRNVMIMAVACSVAFLGSYLTYHYAMGSKKFLGEGLARTIYFSILISHTILAVVIVPLVLTTLYRAKKGNFEAHRTIAKKTVPVWLYVSVTGVIIYCFLYL